MLVQKIKSLLNNNSLNLDQLKKVHSLIITNGYFQYETLFVRQILLSTSGYSGIIGRYIQRILAHMRIPDASSWGFAVRFFSMNGQFKTAFSLYVHMQRLGLCPSSFAFSSALKACAKIGHKLGGISVHVQVYKHGFCGSVYVQTALLDFYSKLGEVKTAQKLFDEMPDRNVVSWNSMLSGYLSSGDLEAAKRVFDEIPRKDVVSWNSMITGHTKMGNMDEAILLFELMPQRNLASWNAVISGYMGCGNVESARRIFDAMPTRNNVSWITMLSGYSQCGDVFSARFLFDQMNDKEKFAYNAMIACYEQNNQPKEAIELFNEMLKPGVNIQPDEMTLTSVISACSQLGYMDFGIWIELYMKKHGIQMDDHLANAFIDMYAKSGNIDKAHELFCGLRKKDVVSYSAMISGCGINGKAVDAIRLFEEMLNAGICPNLVTYKGLLTAYNHVGLVEEGYKCFNDMKDQGLLPLADHYGIMVDLLGRAGRLEEAYELIKSMPVKPHAGVWGALLLACRIHNHVELGEIAARNCFELQPEKTGYSSLLANIYASVERWDDAGRLRGVVEEKGLAKIPGCSWMESF